jgi:hypothetical protein
MADTRKIFIGSSLEALEMARLVGEEIEKAGMVPVVWDTIFPAGDIFLEVIERLPSEVDGAVLLATPDVFCEREEISFEAPVANVVFEYGYLAARLTRKRVAICEFKDAILPSDLKGMTVVRAGDYQKGQRLPLGDGATSALRNWLERLPPLAAGIPPLTQVHGYSGTWDVETRFAKFRGVDLEPNDNVYFKGRMSLFLSADGKGTGIQQGKTTVTVGEYKTSFTAKNRLDAEVDERGLLKLTVYVLRSDRGEESGEPRDPRLRESLSGHMQFSVTLKPGSGEPRTLIGEHHYTPGLRELQTAREEKYTYLGFYYDDLRPE